MIDFVDLRNCMQLQCNCMQDKPKHLQLQQPIGCSLQLFLQLPLPLDFEAKLVKMAAKISSQSRTRFYPVLQLFCSCMQDK